MKQLTRKQREIRDREILIKNTAREMLKQDGFHQLSMDKVAEKVEYSKGTIYQHFTCKEELACALCLESVSQLIGLFNKASALKLSTRERMIAVLYANLLHASLNPEAFQNLQIVRSEAIREKISDNRQDEMLLNEATIFNIVAEIVKDAVKCKDLTLPTNMNVQEVVFGLWATLHGGLILNATNINWNNLGINDPIAAIIKTSTATVDGLGWKPHSSKIDLENLFEQLRTQTFADEFNLQKNTLNKGA